MFATGLSFAVFGTGGVVLRVLVFPLLQLLVWNRGRRTRAARAVVRLSFRFFIAMMVFLGVLRYRITGLERLDRNGLLILSNHPTLIDTVFLMAFTRNANCIVRHGLRNNPFTRGPVRAAGYIGNEEGPELVAACARALEAGENLIVFPEGTRTLPGGAVRLKRGAANIAVRAGRAITPVRIRCSPPTLFKGNPWWRVPAAMAMFHIEVKEDIQVQDFTGEGRPDTLAARHLTEYLQQYYSEEHYSHA